MHPTEFSTAALVAVVVAELIEVVKRSTFPNWLSIDTARSNRIVGGIAAFLTGLGLQFQFDSEAGALIVTGLFWNSIAHGFAQWAAQQVYYRLAINSRPQEKP